ncbi:MAG: LamG domain-containing protein [Kiritimatiellae bacterium]|nr:LamG domain-containing protein [Kiritimatiellia bacterium]
MKRLAIWAMAALGAAGAARGSGTTPLLTTQFGMRWFADAVPDAETDFYAGGAGLVSLAGGSATNRWTDPSSGESGDVSFASEDGALELAFFSYGQPLESPVAQYALGDVIPPPEGVTRGQAPAGFSPVAVGNNAAAYWRNASGSAIWLPSRDELVAAAGGTLEIQWPGLAKPVIYTVEAVPTGRPARVYWTEAPYRAPVVYLNANNQQVCATLHYNSFVQPPVPQTITNYDASGAETGSNTTFVAGIWIETNNGSQCLRAEGVEGILLLEYYEDGKYEQSLGVQPVQVLAPRVERVSASVGDRLLPVDRYYGTDDLVPKITAGLSGGKGDKMFLVDGNSSYAEKGNWLYAIRSTRDTPWDAEVYWEHKDARGVTWPFEVDWYEIQWPADAIRVAFDSDGDGLPAAKTLLPDGIGAEIVSQATEEAPKKEATNARLSNGNAVLDFTAPGLALMRYSTPDDFWMEPLRGVRHDDPAEFDSTAVTWPIGSEILPFSDENYVADFDGEDDYAEGTRDRWSGGTKSYTVEAWIYRTRDDFSEQPVISYYQGPEDKSSEAWELGIDWYGKPYFQTRDGKAGGDPVISKPIPLREWHHLAGVRRENDLFLYVDGTLAATSDPGPIALTPDAGGARHIQIARSLKTGAHFGGRIDEVRFWGVERSQEEIRALMNTSLRSAQEGLLECYPLDEGAGIHIRDVVDGSYGTLYGGTKWIASFHLADHSDLKDLAAFPGFVHSGTAYNVNDYDYPAAWEENPKSQLFAVNTNSFEIWWSRASRHIDDMPAPLHYSSLVLHYDSVWPTDAPEIVIASGKGSAGTALSSPSIYVQNDPSEPGYNPNEEHAVVIGSTVYALRDDLNTASSSEPFVLVDTVKGDGTAGMEVFRVVRTNELYPFEYATKAGAAVSPPMPLAAWEGCDNTTCASGPGWEDRKESWWAKAAGDDGKNTNIIMRFFYRMQPSFNFPELALSKQPAAGTELPWLPTEHKDGGTTGTPADVVYDVSWPVNVPKMDVAQTLAEASGGLPDIWNQASVDVIYQQSEAKKHGPSVVLFDPAIEKTADLSQATVQEMAASNLARKEVTSARYRFGDVSPSLEKRLYYDPDRGRLVLGGMLYAPLTGTPYVLPNWLAPDEKDGLMALGDSLGAKAKSEWQAAVEALPVATATLVGPNDAYANAALSTAPPTNKNAHGYVTLAFNNSTNAARVAQGLPVSLQILRVTTNLWSSQYLDVLEPANALEEKLTLVYPDDFGGEAGDYEFEWRWNEPVAGKKPSTPMEEWQPFFASSATSSSNGAVSIVIEGGTGEGTLFMLSDHYFAVRYRRSDGLGPTGTNWSEWVSSLAPGWIERVMTAINPYDQRYTDMASYAPGLGQTIIEQCGPPYEGAVALNEDAVNEAGLIQIYQTVMDRALSLSLDAGIADSNCNDSLLFAATRLNKLYMALGNEAYADAMDPTVSIDPATDGWYNDYGSLDTTLFCFQNQVPSLLEEELALLRGRDDSREPSVTVPPIYNRLIWNYTYGIDGGEVAYACNYDIHGVATNTTGDIGPEDAKRMFPQGHGDAWGHYLSALAPYYKLLAYTNFTWNTIPGATLVGNATVGVDYLDEESFAAAAAAKARTGADIVGLTARRDYVFGAKGLARWTPDTDTNRCWDVDGWGVRAGQGAYFDWAVANSLLLDTVTNLAQLGADDKPATGLNVIDRAHAPAIGEVAAALDDIQSRLDRADAGLNPLGLDENAIPFDISASGLDAGKGHFEQVYERALESLDRAKDTFSLAKEAASSLRKQYDSTAEAVSAAQQEEESMKNRLIAIYGYPYADDIGASGTYAQGYDGPDLVNYMILDLDETYGPAPVSGVTVTNTTLVLSVDTDNANLLYDAKFATNSLSTVSQTVAGVTMATGSVVSIERSFNSLGLQVKPAEWTGRRRAQGEIQAALYNFVEAYYGFLKAQDQYAARMVALRDEYRIFMVDAAVAIAAVTDNGELVGDKQCINNTKTAMDFFTKTANHAAEVTKGITDGIGKGVPKIIATITGGVEEDIGESAAILTSTLIWGSAKLISMVSSYAGEVATTVVANDIIELEAGISRRATFAGIQKETIRLLDDMNDQIPLIREMQARLAAMDAAMEHVKTLEAEGERVLLSRARARNRIALRLEGARYADMLYRTFRNQALERYSEQQEEAARQAWLAAMAYDYETGLLDPATGDSAAARFLEKIVRSRTLGLFADGVPQVAGAEGDGGLADALARLKADWEVVKPRYGIDNPDSATTRFSLRRELFRIESSSTSDKLWQKALEKCRVDDLGTVDAYTRYCVPYGAGTNAGPGLVIPFSGEITPGVNFFGWPVGGGDNFYDPTWLSTRIRAVGVWFSGYNNAFNTNNASGGGLANTPNVYLVPAGVDTVVNGADRTRTTRRTWSVFDQALPLPFGTGGSSDAASSASVRRRHSAFRAHHDNGSFRDDELCSNARLVGRSVWNSQWVLIIPGRSLLADPEEGIERFIYGGKKDGKPDGAGVEDILLYFKTYSYGGD